MNILWLMVARGGSEGVPLKNLRKIGPLSLIGHKALGALESKHCDRIIISTDSEDIAAEAARFGIEVLFMRPPALATAEAPTEDVIHHALEWLMDNKRLAYDAVMLLEPSSPFTLPEHYDAAVEMFKRQGADLVVGMRATECATVFMGPKWVSGCIAPIVEKMHRSRTGGRRQDQGPEWTMNGALYLIRTDAFRATGRIYGAPWKCFGIEMDRWHGIEIETPEDLEIAGFAYSVGYTNAKGTP